MHTSHTRRSTSHRGLLAGLLALVVFASTAVAMTANGVSGVPSPAPPSQAGATAVAPAGAVMPAAGPFRDGGQPRQVATGADGGAGDGGDGGAGRQDVVARGGRGR